MKSSHTLRAAVALALGLAVSPAFADDAALKAEVDALRAAISEQRALLDSQAKLLEAQQAQLEALTRQLGQPKVAAAGDAERSPLPRRRNSRSATTGPPSPPRTASPRSRFAPTCSSTARCTAKTRKVRSPRIIAAARSAPLPIAKTMPRATSATASISAARVSASKAPSRSDFNYRLLLELGGSGTEGPTRINDAWIAYTGLAPFTFQLGAFSPPANMDDGTTPEDLPFLERASASELSRSLGGADGRIGLGLKANGKRWMSAFTMTTRTVNDAEVFDGQLAAVGRAGGLIATGSDYNVHLGASGTYVFSPADQGSSGDAAAPRHPLPRPARDPRRQRPPHRHRRHRRRARQRARHGVRRELEELLSTGRTLLVRRRAPRRRGPARSRLHGLLRAGQLDAHGREPPLQPGHRLIPESATESNLLARRRRRRVGTRRALQQHESEFPGRRSKAPRRCPAACAAASRTCSRSA